MSNLFQQNHELIKIHKNQGRETVNARDLWQNIESKQHFADWIKSRVDNFIQDIDYIGFHSFMNDDTVFGGKRKIMEYYFTVDAAKQICMMENTEKGREVRKYFIECEKRLKAKTLNPEQMVLESIKYLQGKIDEMKPKADFYDAVTGSDTTIDIGEAAKVLNAGIGRNKLFELLRYKKILQENNQPYQKYIDCGYFRVIESKYTKPDGSINISLKTVVYQKGLDYMRKLIGEQNDL